MQSTGEAAIDPDRGPGREPGNDAVYFITRNKAKPGKVRNIAMKFSLRSALSVWCVLLCTVHSYVPLVARVNSDATCLGRRSSLVGRQQGVQCINSITGDTSLDRDNSQYKLRGFARIVSGLKNTCLKAAGPTCALLGLGRSAKAAVTASTAPAGWDLYGRVPYDDWLFTTNRLLDKDLLKRSFVEVIQQEIPVVLGNFNRKKAIYTALVILKGVAAILGGLTLLGWIVLATRERMRRDKALEVELRGFSTPVSAAYKGARNQGREVEGAPGWVDMSRRNLNKREDDEKNDAEDELNEDDGAKKKNGDGKRSKESDGDVDGDNEGTGGDVDDGAPESGGRGPGPSNPRSPQDKPTGGAGGRSGGGGGPLGGGRDIPRVNNPTGPPARDMGRDGKPSGKNAADKDARGGKKGPSGGGGKGSKDKPQDNLDGLYDD